MINDEQMMRMLQEKLRTKIETGDKCGPFYAAVVSADGTIVAESANSVVPENCSHNHAEMNAIRLVEEKLGSWNLSGRGLTLYTTAEPCMMCVGGILWSGIERVVYGVGTEAVERITGFDEGFKPNWREEFAHRGISVTGPVLSEVGEEVLRLYLSRQSVVYSPHRSVAVLLLMALTMLTGCESAHVGMGIPVPGPIKPSVGVSVNKSSVKGHGGVSAKAGPVPISVGGTTKPIKVSEASDPAKSTKKTK